MKNVIKKLILSGGGAKGVAYIGVIKYIEELKRKGDVKFEIDEMCCVSIGSVFGILYTIGYNYQELFEEIMKLDIDTLKMFSIKNVVKRYGLDDGKLMMKWLEYLFVKKGLSKNFTLRDVFDKYGVNFRVVVTNVNKYCIEIFDSITNPNLKVIKAIRMSTNIPFVFCTEVYNGNTYVDGGILNNYPMKLYEGCNLDNILGCKLITKGELGDTPRYDIDSFETYVVHLMGCVFANKERDVTLTYKYIEHTICIDAYKITSAINFSLTDQDKLNLIEIGYNSAREYFEKC